MSFPKDFSEIGKIVVIITILYKITQKSYDEFEKQDIKYYRS